MKKQKLLDEIQEIIYKDWESDDKIEAIVRKIGEFIIYSSN